MNKLLRQLLITQQNLKALNLPQLSNQIIEGMINSKLEPTRNELRVLSQYSPQQQRRVVEDMESYKQTGRDIMASKRSALLAIPEDAFPEDVESLEEYRNSKEAK